MGICFVLGLMDGKDRDEVEAGGVGIEMTTPIMFDKVLLAFYLLNATPIVHTVKSQRQTQTNLQFTGTISHR
jgi:hypothetical protein